MIHVSYRKESRKDYGEDRNPSNTDLCREQLMLGCMLRIADALEKMARPYVDLIERADRLDKDTISLAELCDKKDRQIRGLRGAFKRMQKGA